MKIVDVAAPAVLTAISLIHPLAVFTDHDQPPTACAERRDIRYCVYADNQPRLAELVHPIDADLAHGLEVAWLNLDGTIQTPVPATIAGVTSVLRGTGRSTVRRGR